MMEFQITKEYLGCATHLVYLGPMYKEVLDTGHLCPGPGLHRGRVVDGALDGHASPAWPAWPTSATIANWCGLDLQPGATGTPSGGWRWDHDADRARDRRGMGPHDVLQRSRRFVEAGAAT